MSQIIQRCPTDLRKLLNPITGRCVIESNPTIKKLLKEGWTIVITANTGEPPPPPSSGIKVFKVCPTDASRLVNPETGRCVKHDNITIKKLLKNGWTIAVKKNKEPVIAKQYGNITNWKKLKKILDTNRDNIIDITEYLGSRPIEEHEETQPVGNFTHLYKSENLYLFLNKEISRNPVLRKNLCTSGGEILISADPLQPDLPYYSMDFNNPNYRYKFVLNKPILFQAPLAYEKKSTASLIMYPTLVSTISNCKNRYLALPLTITNMNILTYFGIKSKNDKIKHESHANVLIIDTWNQTIERFDPHGSVNYSFTNLKKDPRVPYISSHPVYNNKTIDNYLKQYFKNLLPEYNYKDITYSCPYLGPQIKADVRSGYCVTWTIMYTFLRLMNPDVPPGRINKMLLDDKTENIREKLLKFAKYYTDVIKYIY